MGGRSGLKGQRISTALINEFRENKGA